MYIHTAISNFINRSGSNYYATIHTSIHIYLYTAQILSAIAKFQHKQSKLRLLKGLSK